MDKKPDVAQAKSQVMALMKQEGIAPQQLVALGQMSERAISDPAIFQVLKQQMIANDMADEADLSEQNKYRFLAVIVTLGKMAEQMMQTGELRG